MYSHINTELVRMKAQAWFKRGRHGKRSAEECEAYVEAAEDLTLTAFESLGHTSMAVTSAHDVMNTLEELFEVLLNL